MGLLGSGAKALHLFKRVGLRFLKHSLHLHQHKQQHGSCGQNNHGAYPAKSFFAHRVIVTKNRVLSTAKKFKNFFPKKAVFPPNKCYNIMTEDYHAFFIVFILKRVR